MADWRLAPSSSAFFAGFLCSLLFSSSSSSSSSLGYFPSVVRPSTSVRVRPCGGPRMGHEERAREGGGCEQVFCLWPQQKSSDDGGEEGEREREGEGLCSRGQFSLRPAMLPASQSVAVSCILCPPPAPGDRSSELRLAKCRLASPASFFVGPPASAPTVDAI